MNGFGEQTRFICIRRRGVGHEGRMSAIHEHFGWPVRGRGKKGNTERRGRNERMSEDAGGRGDEESKIKTKKQWEETNLCF